jgi:CheY-like chemotaxis protein
MSARPLPLRSEDRLIRGRLLIVHNDPAFRCAVRRVLGEAGYLVVECDNEGEAILRTLRGEEYRLILCDVEVPLGAIDFHERLSAMNPRMAARVVFLAGDDVEIRESRSRSVPTPCGVG